MSRLDIYASGHDSSRDWTSADRDAEREPYRPRRRVTAEDLRERSMLLAMVPANDEQGGVE